MNAQPHIHKIFPKPERSPGNTRPHHIPHHHHSSKPNSLYELQSDCNHRRPHPHLTRLARGISGAPRPGGLARECRGCAGRLHCTNPPARDMMREKICNTANPGEFFTEIFHKYFQIFFSPGKVFRKESSETFWKIFSEIFLAGEFFS